MEIGLCRRRDVEGGLIMGFTWTLSRCTPRSEVFISGVRENTRTYGKKNQADQKAYSNWVRERLQSASHCRLSVEDWTTIRQGVNDKIKI